MSKWIVVALAACLLLGSGVVAWTMRHRLTDAPSSRTSAEYTTFVDRCGGNETDVRSDLNRIAATGTCTYGAADAGRVASLQNECSDPKVLLEIECVASLVDATNLGEPRPFDFLSAEQAARLKIFVGDKPSATRVNVFRANLAKLAAVFGEVRRPPDWNVKIEGDKPPMPFLDLLRAASEFMPHGSHPRLYASPVVPTFCALDAELLEHLERYFNTPAMKAAFPEDRFPKLYANGRISALPWALAEYRTEILRGINQEKAILLPGKTPDPEQAEAVDEIFARLLELFDATITTVK